MAGKPQYIPVFVGRQAVYTQDREVWGYELLFRSGAKSTAAAISNDTSATAQVIIDGFALADATLEPGRKALINFPENLLLKGAPLVLPAETCIVEVLETVTPSKEVVAALRKLKDKGYTVALDDFVGQEGYEPILEIADIVKMEVLNRSMTEIIKTGQTLQQYGCELLAEKIEDQEIFELSQALGCTYYQGFYFSKPEILSGRKLPSAEMSRLRVLKELGDAEYKVGHVARIIGQDAGLSYRLLKYVNSAFRAMRKKVSSLAQAVTLMGGKPLKRWLMVAMMADMKGGGQAEELTFRSAMRGRFLEKIAEKQQGRGYEPDAMFMLGLFSNLDAMLGMPMHEITAHLPLDSQMEDALCGQQNAARQWIDLAAALEEGDWKKSRELMREKKLAPEAVAMLHAEAGAWACALMGYKEAKTQDLA